jgi:hypothetical protein
MTTGATGQLGLALPVQGELTGTWGNTVNNAITEYTNIAIAATLTLTNDGAVTLANTTGTDLATNITSSLTGAGTVTAQFAIVRVTGTLTVAKVVTAPSYSKTYTVVNAATGGIVTFKASGQTGVSIAVGESAFVYYNGTDYVKVSSTVATGVTSFTAGTTGFTPSTATTGAVTLAGTLGVANGGTGATTLTANNVILGNGTSAPLFVAPSTSGNVLTSNGTTWASTAPAAGTTFSGGTTGFTPSTATSGAVTLAGTLATTNGGTGLTSFTSGGVVYASSTSALATGTGLNFNGNLNLGGTALTGTYGRDFSISDSGNDAYSSFGIKGLAAGNGNTYHTFNAVNNGAFTWAYRGSQSATLYQQNGAGDPSHTWYVAPIGTAGNAITFTQVFKLYPNGSFGVGSAGSQGTSGQVLTSAGTGSAPTWTTIGGSSWVYLTTVTASNSATVDVENAFDSTYSTYVIVISDMYPASGGETLYVRFKLGGIYSTGSYKYMGTDNSTNAASTYSGYGAVNQAQGVLTRYQYQASAARTLNSTMFIANPSGTSSNKYVYGMGTYNQDNDSHISQTFSVQNNGSVTALTGIRFLMNSGNITAGTFRLYGIKAS